MSTREQQIAALEKDWAENPRWKGVKRGYSAADVVRLRGSLPIDYTLAKRGADTLWAKVNGGAKKGYVNAFGAITAGQAMQQAKAGLEAVYLSGWQVAADGNTSAGNADRPGCSARADPCAVRCPNVGALIGASIPPWPMPQGAAWATTVKRCTEDLVCSILHSNLRWD